MERKLKIFLFSTILVLFLVGLYFVNATISIDNGASTIVSSGEAHETKNITQLANWTMGGLSEWFNFTINSTWVTNQEGINKTNITIPGGYSMNNLEANAGVNNGTSQNWTTMNNTITRTVAYSLSLGDNNVTGLIGPINFSMNLTAITGVEEIYTFNITSWGNQSNISSKLISMGVDGLAPRASNINATDGTNIRSTDFNASTYLKNDSDLVIRMTVTDYNIWRVILLYNNTGGTVNLTDIGDGGRMAPHASNGTGRALSGHNAVFIEMTNRSTVNTGSLESSAPSYVYTANLSKENYSSSGTPITFAFLVYDLYNQSKQVNNSDVVYQVVADGTEPTAILTAPSITNVAQSTSIAYTCAGSDPNGTISNYTLVATKPSGAFVTNTSSSATFAGAQINEAGAYSVYCNVTDGAGRVGQSSTLTFIGYVAGVTNAIDLSSGKTTFNATQETAGVVNITDLNKWTRGGSTEFFNLTLNWSGIAINISSVNISIPSGYALNALNPNFTVSGLNGTTWNWSVYNTSNTLVAVINTSLGSAMFASINFFGLRFNLTAGRGVESVYTFNVSTYDNQSGVNSTTFTMGVDGLAPRASDVNATDGTHIRSTGFDTSTYVKNDSNLVVKMTVTDYNIWRVILLYNKTGGMVNLTDIGDGSRMAPHASNG